MINFFQIPGHFGEKPCFYDVQTGDYSTSLHGVIAELTTENERLQGLIADLLLKNECLRYGTEQYQLGSA